MATKFGLVVWFVVLVQSTFQKPSQEFLDQKQCAVYHGKNLQGGTSECLVCNPFFGLDTTGNCVPCAQNCEICAQSGPGSCDVCRSDDVNDCEDSGCVLGYGVTKTGECCWKGDPGCEKFMGIVRPEPRLVFDESMPLYGFSPGDVAKLDDSEIASFKSAVVKFLPFTVDRVSVIPDGIVHGSHKIKRISDDGVESTLNAEAVHVPFKLHLMANSQEVLCREKIHRLKSSTTFSKEFLKSLGMSMSEIKEAPKPAAISLPVVPAPTQTEPVPVSPPADVVPITTPPVPVTHAPTTPATPAPVPKTTTPVPTEAPKQEPEKMVCDAFFGPTKDGNCALCGKNCKWCQEQGAGSCDHCHGEFEDDCPDSGCVFGYGLILETHTCCWKGDPTCPKFEGVTKPEPPHIFASWIPIIGKTSADMQDNVEINRLRQTLQHYFGVSQDDISINKGGIRDVNLYHSEENQAGVPVAKVPVKIHMGSYTKREQIHGFLKELHTDEAKVREFKEYMGSAKIGSAVESHVHATHLVTPPPSSTPAPQITDEKPVPKSHPQNPHAGHVSTPPSTPPSTTKPPPLKKPILPHAHPVAQPVDGGASTPLSQLVFFIGYYWIWIVGGCFVVLLLAVLIYMYVTRDHEGDPYAPVPEDKAVVEIHADVYREYNKIFNEAPKMTRFMIMKIDSKQMAVIVDHIGKKGLQWPDQYAAMMDCLPRSQCRYVIIDFDLDNRRENTMIMMSWVPANASSKEKGLYAQATDTVKSNLEGVQHGVRVTDKEQGSLSRMTQKVRGMR